MSQPPADPIFAEFLADSGWSRANKINAVSVLNRWARWCANHDTAPITATRADCTAYLDTRAGELAAATLRVEWRMLRAFYGWLARDVADGGGGERDDDPMRRVKGPRTPTRPATRAAKAGDVAALERCFDQSELGRRNTAMVSLMYRSGLRVGELPQLDLADYTTIGEGRAVLTIKVTKTGEPRVVPVHPETQRYLTRYFRKRGTAVGPLFRGATHTRAIDGRITTKAIQDVIRRARERTGIAIAPHQLRRGFTAAYLRDGGDVLSLEIIGGWADHRMPRRYLADEEAAAAIDRYFDVADGKRRLRSV